MPNSRPSGALVEPPGGGPPPRVYRPSMVSRKRLSHPERLTAAGVGVAVGAVVAYVLGLWMQRTPLLTEDDVRPPRTPRGRSRA